MTKKQQGIIYFSPDNKYPVNSLPTVTFAYRLRRVSKLGLSPGFTQIFCKIPSGEVCVILYEVYILHLISL